MILIDLKKPFDTLDYKTLLGKMKCIRFSDKTIKWFNSYFKNSFFFQFIGPCVLEAGTTNFRVPQGRVSGS